MKNLLFVLFFLLGFGVYSQINVDSISFYMFEIHNDMRSQSGSAKRYLSNYCKQASKTHLDYLLKYGFSEGHYETKINVGNKILNKPIDRYNYFNRDSVKYNDIDYVGYYKPYKYTSEICNYQTITLDLNDKSLNRKIALELIENYMVSKLHYNALFTSNFDEQINRCYFSVNYKIENGKYVFYSVGVFDRSLTKKFNLTKDYQGGYDKLY
jgi:hypothetical protein